MSDETKENQNLVVGRVIPAAAHYLFGEQQPGKFLPKAEQPTIVNPDPTISEIKRKKK